MSAPDRRAMVERPGKDLSVRRQCALVEVARSGSTPQARPPGERSGGDAPHRRTASRSSVRRLAANDSNEQEGRGVNRKRVRRLMRVMGIRRWFGAPARKAAPVNKIYPYLLRGLKIVETNHVWAADVTYIPMSCGFLYLVAIIDWASRAGPAWRLSNTTMRASAGGAEGGAPSVRKAAIFNTDQGSTFTAEAFTSKLVTPASDFDGRTRPLHGQHFHRTAVALDQVRRSTSKA